MKVSVEDAGPCRKVMQVEVPPDGVRPEFDEVAKAYTRAARVPGFRKGKTPMAIIESRDTTPAWEPKAACA